MSSTIVPSEILQEWIENYIAIGCAHEIGVRLILLTEDKT